VQAVSVWLPEVAPPATLTLLDGQAMQLRHFLQGLAHEALRRGAGPVLWCDGSHAFDPYDFAELNLTRGLAADDGAERLLVKRCMTPFQWYTTLSRLLPERIRHAAESGRAGAELAVVHPFDALFSTDELSDWEQEDYVRFVVPHLRRVAAETGVPILLAVDMAKWWRTHPTLAQATHEGVAERWSVAWTGDRFRAWRGDGEVLDPDLRRRTTLLDFVEEPVPVMVPAPRRRKVERVERPWRTRIVHEERS
jgi:hypothetical protein